MRERRPIAALVPVRGLAEGKRRLAAALTGRERQSLVRAMLEDVLDALQGCAGIAPITVVSSDAAVAAIAGERGVLVLADPPAGGLNASLQRASACMGTAYPKHAVLMVAADLPGLTPTLLESTVLASSAEVVIARSRDGGTNLLLQRPPAALRLAFGPESCAQHRATAARDGRTVEVLEHPLLAYDLDGPDDLRLCLPLPATGRACRLLRLWRVRNSFVPAAPFAIGDLG